jgi:hypothetical protein
VAKLNKTRTKTGQELDLCKPDLASLYSCDNRQANLNESGIANDYCIDNKKKFEFNKKMEGHFYGVILRKFFNILGFGDKAFVENYAAYMRFFPDFAATAFEEFKNRTKPWGEVETLGIRISPGDNAEFMNRIVRDFFKVKDKKLEPEEGYFINITKNSFSI